MSTNWAYELNTTSALWQGPSLSHSSLWHCAVKRKSVQLPSRWKHDLTKRVAESNCKTMLYSPWTMRVHGQGAEGTLGNETVRSGKTLTVGKRRLRRSFEKIKYRASRLTYMVSTSWRQSCFPLCVLARSWQCILVLSFWSDFLASCWSIAFGRASSKKSCGVYCLVVNCLQLRTAVTSCSVFPPLAHGTTLTWQYLCTGVASISQSIMVSIASGSKSCASEQAWLRWSTGWMCLLLKASELKPLSWAFLPLSPWCTELEPILGWNYQRLLKGIILCLSLTLH